MVKTTSWGKVAGWYDGLLKNSRDTYQENVIKPNLLRIVSIRLGQKILDIGCGQGFFSREFAKIGAEVVGVDVAGELIKLAKKQSGRNEQYHVLSAEDLSGLRQSDFDAAVCVLALQNIKGYQQAISEIAKKIKVGGKMFLVLNHPCFRIPKKTSWGFDERQDIQFRGVDAYLSEIQEQIDMTPGEKKQTNKKYTWSFHRPLQAYAKAFEKSGFAITRIEEWNSHKVSDKGMRKAAEDRARKEIPMFMCLELKKIKDY